MLLTISVPSDKTNFGDWSRRESVNVSDSFFAAASDTKNEELEVALIKDTAFVLVLASMSALSEISCNALRTAAKLSVKRGIESCR